LGRTGTRSLTDALRVLGFDPVLHNPLTYEEVLDARAAAEGAVLNHWKALMTLRPESKFVLTLHLSVEHWLDSSRRAMENYPLERLQGTEWWPYLVRNRMYRWGSLDFQPRAMRDYYLNHASEVIRTLRRTGRLLVLFTGDGWESLCPFLDLPIPKEPYPHVRD